jgi:hypothetical protein
MTGTPHQNLRPSSNRLLVHARSNQPERRGQAAIHTRNEGKSLSRNADEIEKKWIERSYGST